MILGYLRWAKVTKHASQYLTVAFAGWSYKRSIQHPVSSIWHPACGVQHAAYSAIHQTSIRCPVSSTQPPAFCDRHPASGFQLRFSALGLRFSFWLSFWLFFLKHPLLLDRVTLAIEGHGTGHRQPWRGAPRAHAYQKKESKKQKKNCV